MLKSNAKLKVLSVGVSFFLGNLALAQSSKTDTAKVIEEVVVVAYGKQKKETTVGSTAQISAGDIGKRPITNVANVIDGAAPGIQVSAGDGQPGSLPSIRIRGFSSYSAANSPLYVVDGVVFNGSIAALNPQDIESMSVLKDASSTSLYGSSAANGVILITTKKGKKGRDRINFSANTAISQRGIQEYDRVDPMNYYLLNWEAIRNGRLTTGASATTDLANTYANANLINVLGQNIYNVANNELVVNGTFNPNASLKFTDLDWGKDLFKTGIRQAYDLNYSGSGEKSTYYASIGYLNDKGYLIKSDFEKLSARLNTESQLRDWVKVGINLFGAHTLSNNGYDGASNNSSIVNPYRFSRFMSSIYSPYLHNADGSNVYDDEGQKVYDFNQLGTTPRGGSAYTGRNAIYELMLNMDKTRAYNINSRAFAEFQILKDLKFTINGGFDTRNTYRREYGNNILGDSAPGGSAAKTSTFTRSSTFNQLLNYTKRLDSHNFDFLLGHENNSYYFEYLYGYKQGQVGENNDDLANFITPTSLTSYTDSYTKEAYFTRLNYDYNEKYLLSASFRRDASSRFAPEYRWENFWSVGGGWRVNKENFMSNVNFVNELKLRASYGQVGNDQGISYYAYKDLFSFNNNATEGGLVLYDISKRDITWESNNQFDAGVDFSFLNRRVSGSFEWYRRITDGLLFNVPVPVSSGIPDNNIIANVGALENKGIEASLNLGIVRNSNFKWDFTVNASTLHNEMTKLPEGQTEIINGSKKLMVGTSIYDYWLRQWYGVDPSNGDGLFLLDEKYISTPITGQDKQIDGVWVTNRSSRAKYDYSGSAIPDVFGSVRNEFTFKNITLSALITYQFGGKVFDSNYQALMSGYPQGLALHTDMQNRWQNPGDITDVPRVDSSLYSQYSADSSRWLVDASFVALRNVTLNYTFGKRFTETFNVNSFSAYLSGENLYSKTKRKGLEPQENFNGLTTNRYTPARIISLGINASF